MSSFSDESSPLTERERVLVRRLLRSTQDFPAEFKSWLPQELEINPPRLLASTLLGLSIKVSRFIFDADGVYTPSPNTLSILVELVGGGGGGGGTASTGAGTSAAGAGGGGGEYTSAFVTNVQQGDHAITVGGGAAGGIGYLPGGGGGDTDFTMLPLELGTVPTAHGGGGGAPGAGQNVPCVSSLDPGVGGGHGSSIFGNNCLNAVGEAGGWGIILSGIQAIGGVGGSAAGPYGGAGGLGNGPGTGNGDNGQAWGGGGGGGEAQGGATVNGGAGYGGVAVVTEYIVR